VVVKFGSNLEGPNLLFNEAMGSELLTDAGLAVPVWAPVMVTEEFLSVNPACWPHNGSLALPPSPGFAFCTHYLHAGGGRVTQILSGSCLSRVVQTEDFWLVWLLDVCAQHTDHRQALFLEEANRQLRPVFIDHGQMFGGSMGDCDPRFRASRFLDARLYPQPDGELKRNLLARLDGLRCEHLLRKAHSLPEAWKTSAAVRRFNDCLNRLASRALLANTLDALFASCEKQVTRHAPESGFGVQRETAPRLQAELAPSPLDLEAAALSSRCA
jgi:hypothetical protein